MRHLHLHLLSLDFDAEDLKKPRHWIIFNTDYLVPPAVWIEQLETHGRIAVDRSAEMRKVKERMLCPLTGDALADIGAVKQHLRSERYQARLREIASDVV